MGKGNANKLFKFYAEIRYEFIGEDIKVIWL